jgi:uncharacterized membrane protein
MSTDVPHPPEASHSRKASASRFFLRGLAIVLPAILTVAILFWIAGIVNNYIVSPISYGVRYVIAQGIETKQARNSDDPQLVFWDKLPALKHTYKNYLVTEEFKSSLERRWLAQQPQVADEEGRPAAVAGEIPAAWVMQQIDSVAEPPQVYVPLGKRAISYRDYRVVARNVAPNEIPSHSVGVYMEFVTIRYFGSQFLLSAGAVSIAIVLLYFIGRLVTVRLGAWVVHRVETLVLGRLPVISTVYSAVKQVTDFLFSERQIEYNRVVVIEYPRRGIWSIGFVTGDSMLGIAAAAGEPLVSVLIPTSPMPVTGYTMSVPRSDVVDLNITIDQAFQFCVSCGVLVPQHQQVTPDRLRQELSRRLTSEAAAAAKSNGGRD